MTRIEEGRMDMLVSLFLPIEGRVGANSKDAFIDYLSHNISMMRIASGSVIAIKEIDILALDDSNQSNQLLVKRKLMPGYVLQDATSDFIKHADKENRLGLDQIDAWLDFSCLKYKARPEHNKLTAYFKKLSESEEPHVKELIQLWLRHVDRPYEQSSIPTELVQHFAEMANSISEELLKQWQEYVNPNDETRANWELMARPAQGYLVPIMNGYRRISEGVCDIENLRGIKSTTEKQGDFENAYFAEATYSIAKWVFVRRISFESFHQYFWQNQHNPELGLYSCVMSNGV
jgi:CRISPR-associated protein Csy2